MTPHITKLLNELENIATADYKTWTPALATAEDFVAWAQSRAAHTYNEVMADIAAEKETNATQPELKATEDAQLPHDVRGYGLRRIAFELTSTALGQGYYGNALIVAKGIPCMTPEDRSLLDAWLTGLESGTDFIELQTLANKILQYCETYKGI